MESITIYLKIGSLLLLIAAPFIIYWDRKRMYGRAEQANRLFLERSGRESAVRLQQYQNQPAARPEFSNNGRAGNSQYRLLETFHYSQSAVLKQYLPIFILIGLAITVPFLFLIYYGIILPEFKASVLLTIGSVWLLFGGLLLFFLRRSQEVFCLIYDDALLFNHRIFNSHWFYNDMPQVLIPNEDLQWLGPCTPEVNRALRRARVPLRIILSLTYLTTHLPKWVLVYSDGQFRYGLLFYPSPEMIRAFQHHFPNQMHYCLDSILQSKHCR
ncbi:MAG: hypothetical protein ACOX6L_08625 [Syntrophomonadaceae bacterium]|jgi:hypothetical protein